jgi:hypothetical protein
MNERLGFLFSYHLTRKRLWLKLFRMIPVAVVALSDVQSFRKAKTHDFFEGSVHRIFVPWRYWLWPYPLSGVTGKAGTFLLETHGGTRIFIRPDTNFHYLLRTRIGQNNAA